MNVEPVINARFKKFKEINGLEKISEGIAFERFVNNTILSAHQPDAFGADEELMDLVCVGGENDMGIDGLAIKLNGLLVRNTDDISDIVSKFKRANVEFIFIQSKYKPNFDLGELGKFFLGVRDFLSEEHLQPMNDAIRHFLKMKEYLFDDKMVIMWENNPSVRLYYVAMGKWKNQSHHIGAATQLKTDIATMNSYSNTETHFIDADALKNICDSNDNTFSQVIDIIDTMELTSVNGVENSCIALCTADEFIKLIVTEDQIIRKALFDDNVRDFQGMNNVNNEIKQTIEIEPEKFAILNNGITIVCDEYTPGKRKIVMKNPQIVNGCQTSHVIYEAYKNNIPLNMIPLNLKIIATNDLEIINQIVKGTNRQNIVLDEAFETTKKFHKDLEEFFEAYPFEHVKIYYERRSKQYNHDPRIKPAQKINLRILIQSFVAMFFNKPHIAHRHESKLLKEFANNIFQEHHSRLPYFTAALTFYLLEDYFRNSIDIKRKYYTYRSHILTIIREVIIRESKKSILLNLNFEKGTDQYCNVILDVLKSNEKTADIIKKSLDIFEKCIDHWTKQLNKSYHGIKDSLDFTKVLLEQVGAEESLQDFIKENGYRGKVIKIIKDRYGNFCGFIEREPNNIFFHSKKNPSLDFNLLLNRSVNYKVEEKENDIQAISVQIVQ